MAIRISVIVPTYKDWHHLAGCLDALERQTLTQDQFEILIVNNEAENVCSLQHIPANAKLLHEPRPGSYAARNAAVAASLGQFLAFTDSDCVPDRQWLARGLSLLDRNPLTRVTGPVPIFRAPGASYSAYLYDRHSAFHQEWAVKQGRCVTANLMVARDVFNRVGQFDPALASGGDTEWGMRAAEMGVPIVFDNGVVVEHPSRTSVAAIYQKRRRIAGSEAVRLPCPAYRYVLARLLPPLRVYRELNRRRTGPPRLRDRVLLFLLHWVVRVGEAKEFRSCGSV